MINYKFDNPGTMKQYAVFAKRVKNPENAEFVIWHFLNDTNDIMEAIHWRQAALEHDDYTTVIIVSPIAIDMDISLTAVEVE